MSAVEIETPLTASDIRSALRKRWPDDSYLTIDEAPDGADRMGRKVDLVAISLWRSRGYEIDAVEIKVSMSDWMREVNQAQKADFWWRHSHRFWVAVPAALALKVRQTLPETWGLLAVTADGAKVAVQAKKHPAEPLTWPQCIGLLRASANAGIGALARREQAGYQRGYEAAKREIERTTGDAHLRRQLDDLRATVEGFEKASGISLARCWDAAAAGRLYKFADRAMRNPQRAADQLFRAAANLDQLTAELRDIGGEIQRIPTELGTHNDADATAEADPGNGRRPEDG